jgi:hypothetical protein
MAGLRRRLRRLEQDAVALVPDQFRCPACRGRGLLAFSDEPNNVGPVHPYDGPNGICRLCRMPPPSTRVLQLSPSCAEHFAMIPWSDEPRLRYIEKMTLLMALGQHDTPEAKRIVTRLFEHDASGQRRWRFPESMAHA